MSAGHRHGYRHTRQTSQELKRLLGTSRVRAYLDRPYRTDYSRQIPLTGGSSRDGRTYYVDPHVAHSDRKYVLWHERVEKALRDALGMHYSQAHTLATCAEREMVEAHGWDWAEYSARVGKVVKRDEGERGGPRDLDLGPYQESGEMKLLRDHGDIATHYRPTPARRSRPERAKDTPRKHSGQAGLQRRAVHNEEKSLPTKPHWAKENPPD